MPAMSLFRRIDRRRVLRALALLAAWAALTAVVWGLMPHEPRISFALPEGTEIESLSPHHRAVVLSSGNDSSPYSLWDLETGELRKDISKELRQKYPFNFIANDSLLILEGNNAVYDVSTDEVIFRLPTDPNSNFWLSPDGRFIVFTTTEPIEKNPGDWTLRLTFWDTALRQVQSHFLLPECRSLHSGIFRTDGFSPDSRWFVANVSESLDLFWTATERGWEIETGPGRGAFSPDSRTLAYYQNDEKLETTIVLWDLEQKKRRAEIHGYWGEMEFTHDSKVLVTHSEDMIKLWDAATGRELNQFQQNPKFRRMFHPSSIDRLIENQYASQNILWDTSCRPARIIQTYYTRYPLSVSSDGALMVASVADPPIVCLDGSFLLPSDCNYPNYCNYTDLIDLKAQQTRCRMPYYDMFEKFRWFRSHQKLECFSPDSRLFARSIYTTEEPPLMERMMNWMKDQAPLTFPPLIDAIEVWDVNGNRRLIFMPNAQLLGFSADGKTLAVFDNEKKVLQIWDVPLRKSLWKILAWSLGLGLYVFGIRWICGRILRAPARGLR